MQFEATLKYLFCFVTIASIFIPSWVQAHTIKETKEIHEVQEVLETCRTLDVPH